MLGQWGRGGVSLGSLGESVDEAHSRRGPYPSARPTERPGGLFLCKCLSDGGTTSQQEAQAGAVFLWAGGPRGTAKPAVSPQGTRGSSTAPALTPKTPAEVPGGAPGLAGADGQAVRTPAGLRALSEADLQLGLVTAAALPEPMRSLTLAADQEKVTRRQEATQAAKPAWAQLIIAERRAAPARRR